MLKTGMSKSEIENVLNSTGFFVQIDWLNHFLKEPMTMDMKKFVLLKLAEIYEKIKMPGEAAKMYDNAGIVAITFNEKIKYFLKESELLINAGLFDNADEAMKKAMAQGNSIEKNDIYFTIKDFYRRQAEAYESQLKKNHAIRIYEKLLQMKLSETERTEIRSRLLKLYEKMGRIREYEEMERKP